MKSSTIRRSTLSKETMEVIENLAKEQDDSGLPGEYVRPDEINDSNNSGMSQEIDLLWQNFKTSQFNTNSPTLYLITGIIIGSLATLLIMFGINSVSSNKTNAESGKAPIFGVESVSKEKASAKEPTLEEQTNMPQEGSETTTAEEGNEVVGTSETNVDTSNMTKYKVKSGDTIESIIIKHYGTYSPDKAEQIMQVNKMPTLDRINIDQEILLP